MEPIERLINELSDVINPHIKNEGQGDTASTISGVVEKTLPILISSLLYENDNRYIFLISSPGKAHWTYNQTVEYLNHTGNQSTIQLFPPWELLPYETSSPHSEVMGRRLHTLLQLLTDKTSSVITSPKAILKFIMPPDILTESTITVEEEAELNPPDLMNKLIDLGYSGVSLVERPGQISKRGGIIDVYPVGGEGPVRMEMFGDFVEEIRAFNPASQRSYEKSESVKILPTREAISSMVDTDRALNRASKISEDLRDNLQMTLNSPDKDGLEGYIPLIYDKTATLFDYLDEDFTLVTIYPDEVHDSVQRLTDELWKCYEDSILRKSPVLPPTKTAIYIEDLYDMAKNSPIIEVISDKINDTEDYRGRDIELNAQPLGSWKNNLKLFKTDLSRIINSKVDVILAVPDESKKPRMMEFLRIQVPELKEKITVIPSEIEGGFYIPEINSAVISERDIFIKRTKKRGGVIKPPLEDAVPISSFADLSPGDICVHIDHGIGEFQGLMVLNVEGVKGEFALIYYRDDAKLYIPIKKVGSLYKYSSGDKTPITLDKLGGARWKRAVKKARTSAKEIAGELLRLYSERESTRGYDFSEDSVWQYELEDSFPYEETQDQINAIVETKSDMEDQTPMDRLICGDVGFGKTEVAIRVAFKAINDGKQVAVLTPTTILASQHLSTFRERLEDFPINIEMLSRLNKPSKNRKVLHNLAVGTVDIVIGTHRLLSDDIKFNDLGLLIIDEEHKFGVSHKEKIKQLKLDVDCLTLSATPIPRTLQMSLSGIRDISLINTPPHDRLPIYTYVRKYDKRLIRDAIMREVHRGGQVYFIHNRVSNIELVANNLKELLPGVSFRVAHGQMDEDRLAMTMSDFYEGKFDCLVATTIIESGIDNPDVNTIIINNSDMFGLAQLHQLRGRVGRSGVQAFCYLLISPTKKLTRNARSRLSAIKEMTHLGGGISLALKDLEIRGAGTLFGSEQSGHISAVGFETYSRMLEEEVSKIKDDTPPPVESKVELKLSAYLPEGYIPESEARLGIYRQLMNAKTVEELEDLEGLLIDMYGSPPREGETLLEVVELRIRASDVGILKINRTNGYIELTFIEPPSPKTLSTGEKVEGIGDIKLKPDGDNFNILIVLESQDDMEIIDALKGFIEQFK